LSRSPNELDNGPTLDDRARPYSDRQDRLAKLFLRLDYVEVRLIRLVIINPTRYPKLLALNSLINILGGGWLYLIAGLILIGLKGFASWRVILAGAISAGVSHIFYPYIKKRLARLRPCDLDSNLMMPVKVLDQYSCPSGHFMTVVATGVPVGVAFPAYLPVIILVWSIIGWSRLVLGHHYPTDLVVGGVMGAIIALPISIALI